VGQKPPERHSDGGNGANDAEKASEAAPEGQTGGENGSEVLSDGADGHEVQDLRPDSPLAPPHDPRAAIAEALGDLMTTTQVSYLIQEVLSVNKRVNFTLHCDHCGNKNRRMAEIPDAKAVVSALTDLLAQGFGRPGEARLDEGTVNFRRLTNLEQEVA
jgi:hypothetical protein